MTAGSVRGRVAVAGVGFSDVARRSDRSLAVLTLEAVGRALASAGLERGDVDGIATQPDAPVFGSPDVDGVDVVTPSLLANLLGARGALRWHSANGSIVANSFVDGVNAVAAGACDVCVVFRAMHNPPGAYNAYTSDLAPGWRQWGIPYGMHRGYQYYGQTYARYLHEYGATREHMAELVVTTRANAARNPHAIWRDTPLTKEEYLASRVLASPLHLLDVDMPMDAALALVLVSAERARDLPAAPAYVAGYGQVVGSAYIDRGPTGVMGPLLSDVQTMARETAERMWRASGLRPTDVDVLQLYDAYSCFTYWWLEGLGVCGTGEAFAFVQDGRIAPTGALPLNTFGGQLGEGRMHGLGHVAEAALQAAGRADARQIPGVDVSVVCSGPPAWGGVAVAFTREPH